LGLRVVRDFRVSKERDVNNRIDIRVSLLASWLLKGRVVVIKGLNLFIKLIAG